MLYNVTITERLSKEVAIEARSKGDAVVRVNRKWCADTITLSGDDFLDVEFEVEPMLQNLPPNMQDNVESG